MKPFASYWTVNIGVGGNRRYFGHPPVPWRDVEEPHSKAEHADTRTIPVLPGLGFCKTCPVNLKDDECLPTHPDCDFNEKNLFNGKGVYVSLKASKRVIYSDDGKRLHTELMNERDALVSALQAKGIPVNSDKHYKYVSGKIDRLRRKEREARA